MLSTSLEQECLDVALPCLAEGSRELFGAEDAILYLQFEDGPSSEDVLHVGGKYCEPDSVLAEKIAEQWKCSELDSQIRRDLRNRYSAVSYSAFSWPYTSLQVVSPDQEVLFSLPQGYAFLLPIHSKMTIRLSGQRPFSGYLVLLFEGFPQFNDIMLSFLISLPQLLSEMAALLAKEREARRLVDIQAYVEETLSFLNLSEDFGAAVASGRPKAVKSMEPDVSDARQALMHSSRVFQLLYGETSALASCEQNRTQVDRLLDSVHETFQAKCRKDGITLERNVFGGGLELKLDFNLFSLALGILVDRARISSDVGDTIEMRAAVTTAREVIFTVSVSRTREAELQKGIHSVSLTLAKKIFELHQGELEIDSDGEGYAMRVRLPWSVAVTPEEQSAEMV